ncbi:MAG: 2-phospho-L-lactate guanylyltransferase [Candidatus Limnocylindrales bacterium]
MHPDRSGPEAGLPPTPRRTAVVIPVRALEGAKSRLGEVLDAEERRELVELLLRRTLEAAQAVPGVEIVAVVSPDAAALAVARSAGAQPIVQHTSGLNPGLVEAREALAGRAERLLILPADLPGITADDVAAVLLLADEAAQGGRPAVVLAPDRHERGTNALLLDPPAVIEPSFGGESRAVHASLAAAAGAAYLELVGRLGLDLDTPDDLLLVEANRPEALHVH